MNFQWLTYLEKENQFDEVQLIGRTVEIQETAVHLIALTRKGETAQLSMLAQTNPQTWNDRQPKSKTIRSSIKADMEHAGRHHCEIKKLSVDGTIMELSGSTSYCLGINENDAVVSLLKLMEAGWHMPDDNVFFEIQTAFSSSSLNFKIRSHSFLTADMHP